MALRITDELNVMLDSSGFFIPILGNLLDNALAYCPAGSSVTVVLGRLDNEIQLREIDNGPGISPDDQARLFERFPGGGVDKLVRAGPFELFNRPSIRMAEA
ncbi:MAG: sensor histidine kinase [Dechloromonas sp.]|uniref:histidine kinase n=1 Tax=Candidatus Dechloromonas phosphorivorans TaxID=2899244 RepID=A0A935MXS4_9RHOO|nr:sensor histidine kinase [Candidatus Dechloromonas phosphorivorans]